MDAAEQALIEAVDRLARDEPVGLPAEVSLRRTRLLLQQSERLRALTLRALSDVDARELFTADGAPSTSAWVDAQAVPGVDRGDVALARRLRTVPRVHDELMAGRLSAVAAAQVTAAVAKARPFLGGALIDGLDAEAVLYGVLVDGVCDQLAEQTGGVVGDHDAVRAELEHLNDPALPHVERVEACLLLLVQRSVPKLVASSLALLLDALLPAQHEARARRAEQLRGFSLHRRHGGSGWTCKGDLDNETGELLATVIDAERAVDPVSPLDTAAWREARGDASLDGLSPDDWPEAQPRPRGKRQQAHDALRSALRALLGTGALGTRDKALPQVVVTVSLDFVEGVPGALPGRTAHGARLARWQVRALLCGSAFTRMVLDARRRAVSVSHTQRTLTAAERQVLLVQWGGRCAGESCCRGPSTGDRLVPHHVDPFSRTGSTSLADTVPLCEREHAALHERRRVLELKDGRRIGPDRWVR